VEFIDRSPWSTCDGLDALDVRPINVASKKKYRLCIAHTTCRHVAPLKRRFQQLLHEQFELPGTVAQTLYVAMLFLHLCDRPRVAGLLGEKIARQKVAINELASIKKELSPKLGTGALHLLKHLEVQRKLDLQWLESLCADIAAGRLHDAPAFSRAPIGE
jgi:hypothetical protein